MEGPKHLRYRKRFRKVKNPAVDSIASQSRCSPKVLIIEQFFTQYGKFYKNYKWDPDLLSSGPMQQPAAYSSQVKVNPWLEEYLLTSGTTDTKQLFLESALGC